MFLALRTGCRERAKERIVYICWTKCRCSNRVGEIEVDFGLMLMYMKTQIRYSFLEDWTYWTFDCGK